MPLGPSRSITGGLGAYSRILALVAALLLAFGGFVAAGKEAGALQARAVVAHGDEAGAFAAVADEEDVAPVAAARPVETPPVETPRPETPPVEAPPVEAPPVEAPPVEAPPVEAPLVEAPPVEASPAEVPLAVASPAEVPPVGASPIEQETPSFEPAPLPEPVPAPPDPAALDTTPESPDLHGALELPPLAAPVLAAGEDPGLEPARQHPLATGKEAVTPVSETPPVKTLPDEALRKEAPPEERPLAGTLPTEPAALPVGHREDPGMLSKPASPVEIVTAPVAFEAKDPPPSRAKESPSSTSAPRDVRPAAATLPGSAPANAGTPANRSPLFVAVHKGSQPVPAAAKASALGPAVLKASVQGLAVLKSKSEGPRSHADLGTVVGGAVETLHSAAASAAASVSEALPSGPSPDSYSSDGGAGSPPPADAPAQPPSPFMPPPGGGSFSASGGGQVSAGGFVPLLLGVLAAGLVLPRRDGRPWWPSCEPPKPGSAPLVPLERPG